MLDITHELGLGHSDASYVDVSSESAALASGLWLIYHGFYAPDSASAGMRERIGRTTTASAADKFDR